MKRERPQSAFRKIFFEDKQKAPASQALTRESESIIEAMHRPHKWAGSAHNHEVGEEGMPGSEQKYCPGLSMPSHVGPGETCLKSPPSNPSLASTPRYRETLVSVNRWCHQEGPGKGWAEARRQGDNSINFRDLESAS